MTIIGRPVQDPTAQTVLRGSPLRGGGLALLSDTQLIETLAHFPRERIPERYFDYICLRQAWTYQHNSE